MSQFVNDVMMGRLFMTAPKAGVPVVYLRNNKMNLQKMILFQLKQMLQSGEIKPDDIFILGGSVKGERSHIRQLENKLVMSGIPCFVPTNETAELNEAVIRGKIVFSTFHQSKGREKEVVVIMGFDKAYFDYYNRSADPNVCPSTLYVGATRAKKLLILAESAEDHKSRPLPFLQMSHHQMMKHPEMCKFLGNPFVDVFGSSSSSAAAVSQYDDNDDHGGQQSSRRDKRHKHMETVTNLIRFIDEEILSRICEWMDDELFVIEHAAAAAKDDDDDNKGRPHCVDIPSIISTAKGFQEEVSDINGKIVPLLYEIKHQNQCTIKFRIDCEVKKCKMTKRHEYICECANQIRYPCESIADYLYMINVYKAFEEGLYFKLSQISREGGDYNWLTDEMVEQCHENMEDHLSCNIEYEHEIINNQDLDPKYSLVDAFVLDRLGEGCGLIRITGRVDAVDYDYNTVWEFKCVKEMGIEHQLQLILYAWLWRMTAPLDPQLKDIQNPEFKLFNIRTGEIRRLNIERWETIDNIVELILKNKFQPKTDKTDAEFIETCYKATRGFLLTDEGRDEGIEGREKKNEKN